VDVIHHSVLWSPDFPLDVEREPPPSDCLAHSEPSITLLDSRHREKVLGRFWSPNPQMLFGTSHDPSGLEPMVNEMDELEKKRDADVTTPTCLSRW
jgi:hypothetical protein